MNNFLALVVLAGTFSQAFATSDLDSLFKEQVKKKFNNSSFKFKGIYKNDDRESFKHDNEILVSIKIYTIIGKDFSAKSCSVRLNPYREYDGVQFYSGKSVSCRKIKFNAERTFDNGIEVSATTNWAREEAVRFVLNKYDWDPNLINYYNEDRSDADIKKVVDRYTLTKVIYGSEKGKNKRKKCTLVEDAVRKHHLGIDEVHFETDEILYFNIVSFRCNSVK